MQKEELTSGTRPVALQFLSFHPGGDDHGECERLRKIMSGKVLAEAEMHEALVHCDFARALVLTGSLLAPSGSGKV